MARTSNGDLIRESHDAIVRDDEADKIADWLTAEVSSASAIDDASRRYLASQIRLHAHRPPPGRREETPDVD